MINLTPCGESFDKGREKCFMCEEYNNCKLSTYPKNIIVDKSSKESD